jgi:hypothetical protein
VGAVALGDLRPGDLIFTHAAHDPVSQKVIELDSGPRPVGPAFSHVFVLLDPDGTMVSSRTHHPGDSRPLDIGGGVQQDNIDAYRDRAPWAARPNPSRDPSGRLVEPAEAAEAARRQVNSRYPERDVNDYSLLKLVLAACALRAFRTPVENDDRSLCDRLRSAVIRAAWAWDASAQPRMGLQPTYFCAELVASVYGASFRIGDLPAPEPSTDGRPTGVEPFRVRPLRGHSKLEAGLAIREVNRLVKRYDPTFHHELGVDIWALVKEHLPRIGPKPRGDGDEDAGVPSEVVTAASPLPTPLVTPRMLLHAPWIEWVREVAIPPEEPQKRRSAPSPAARSRS